MLESVEESFPKVTEFLRGRSCAGHSRGGQLYASINGKPVIDVAWSWNAYQVSATDLVQWASATKVAAAVAVSQPWEKGLFELDDPVERFIPGYGQNGKEGITLRHLLTQTSGLRDLPPPVVRAVRP